MEKDIKVVIALGLHLFPFRTEKLSLTAPMILRNSGKVGHRHFERKALGKPGAFFMDIAQDMSLLVI
jgi:hypothetical protein